MHRPPSSWKGTTNSQSSNVGHPPHLHSLDSLLRLLPLHAVTLHKMWLCSTANWVLHSQGKQSWWWGKARRRFWALRDTAATCRSVSPACQFWRYFGEHRRSLQLLPRQPLEAARKEINSLSLLEDGASTKCILTSQPWGEWMLTLDLDPQESGSELRTLHMDLRSNTWFRGTSQRVTLAEILKPWSWL